MLNQRTLVEQAGAGAGWVSETDVSKRDYTLMAIHCMYSRSGRKGWIESSRCRPKEEEEKCCEPDGAGVD